VLEWVPRREVALLEVVEGLWDVLRAEEAEEVLRDVLVLKALESNLTKIPRDKKPSRKWLKGLEKV